MTTQTPDWLDPEVMARINRRSVILNRIRGALIEALGLDVEPEHIDPDTPLFGSGLGLDSIDAVEVAVVLKSEFGVELTDSEAAINALRTINTAVDTILRCDGEAT